VRAYHTTRDFVADLVIPETATTSLRNPATYRRAAT